MSSYIPRALLDQARPETSDPTYRMSMLPLGTYSNADGSGEHLGLAVPGMVQEPMNALMRLIGTPSQPGTFTQGPEYGSNSEDMRTLLESFLGGNATRGMGAVERGAMDAAGPAVANSEPHLTDILTRLSSAQKAYQELPSGWFGTLTPEQQAGKQVITHIQNELEKARNPVQKASALPADYFSDQPMPSSSDPSSIRAYRGTYEAGSMFDNPKRYDALWASDDPNVANSYAAAHDGYGLTMSPGVAPIDMAFKNPMTVDAGGLFHDQIPIDAISHVPGYKSVPTLYPGSISTEELAGLATDRGHDGLIVRNVKDGPKSINPATTYAALRRGTVTSPLTGETLFSDQLPSLPGAVIAGAEKSKPGLLDTLRGWFGRSPVDPNVARAQELYHKYPGEMSALPNDVPDWVYIPKNQYNWNEYPNHFFGDDEAIKKAAINVGDDQAPIGPNDQSYLNALLRQRKVDEGSLFANGNGLPSLWGSALQGDQQPYPNSLFTY